jgi:hypothetical protein
MLSFLNFLSADPAAWIRTGLRVVHFCGLVLGVGAATLLDLIIARFVLMRGISKEHIHVIDFSSKIVTVGLSLLWISGIGFLFYYGFFDPPKLQNPKIWAKIAIVAVLSINGILVHFFVLPRIRNQVGKRLLDGLSQFHCSLLLLAGTVSAISWYVPLMLGAIPQLNFVVPAEAILVSYALLLIAVNTVIQGAVVLFLGDYSMPVISDRSKLNMLRGSFAIAFALICASLFATKKTDYGEALADSAKRVVAGEPKVALASKGIDLEHRSSGSDKDASHSGFESEQSHIGALAESAVTAVWQNEGKFIEQTELASSANAAEQKLVGNPVGSESFAGVISKGSRGTDPSQLKNGFVGLWAAEARACEFRSRMKNDLLTFVDEHGARAGGSTCVFKEKKPLGNSEWEMKAACADASARWESTVRLSVSKNKLTWSGQRGSQTYVRCTGNAAFAQANDL